MKRLCFGTLFNILYQSRAHSKVTVDSLCNAIFAVYGLDKNLYGSSAGHLKNGHDNLPSDLIRETTSKSFDEIDIQFQNIIVPLIKENKKESLVRAIKEVLREDTSIANYTIVGYIKGYEKDNIVKKSTFSFSALLASVFYYAIVNVSNKDCKDSISEIKKEYVESFDTSAEPVYFESSDAEVGVPLKRTLKDPTFNRIFEKVYDTTITGLSNPSTIQIYSADIANSKFRFKDVKEFIVDNIGNYVMSREKVNRMEKIGKGRAIGSQALLRYIKAAGVSMESVLAETMLYVFLEQELDAPKIMSKIEIDDIGGQGKSKSDGVHLYSSDVRGTPFTQLVFGASHIIGNLQVAVDNAFAKVLAIEQNSENELQMVDNTLNANIFEAEVISYMKNVLKPQKGKGEAPELAFGCFLGYTLNVIPSEPNKVKYKLAAKKQMENDIVAIQPYIEKAIIDNGLSDYDFYFYVLPFNNADTERISMVKEMTGGI